MPSFSYHANDHAGKSQRGSIEALSEADAYRRLREQGLQPVSLVLSGDQTKATGKRKDDGKTAPSENSSVGPLPRFSRQQLLFFTEELSELLEAGLQLEAALRVLAERQEKSPIGPVSARLRSQVREGVSFSAALRGCGTFDPLYCNLVAAGEAAGVLPRILKRQCEHLEMVGELAKKVSSALVYPSIVFSSAILLMFIFLTFLVPQLSVLLGKSGQKLPLMTRILIDVSLFCGHYWWALFLGAFLIAAGIKAALQTPGGRSWWDQAQLGLPVVGPVLRARFLAETTQNLATLVSNGVSMMASMGLLRGSTTNVYLGGLLEKITVMISEGASLSGAMRRTGFFPPVLLDILGVGEQTGDLSGSLQRAAKRYDRELSTRIQVMTSLIQPAVILIVALFVGIVAYSMISGILTSVNALKVR
jgi:type II secretory pathway component PulF